MAAIAMVLTVFNACTKDELKTSPDDGIAKTSKADVYLENGYLAFKNMNAVDSTMNVLSKMTRQEKDVWEQQMGLKSARAEFDKLFDEYEKLTSKEEFLKFKSKYADQLKFNEMDETDCSIGYPFESTYFASVMNTKGIFKVGISLFKYTKENQIIVLDGDKKKLENLSAYANDKTVLVYTKLKSGGSNRVTDLITDFPSFDPNEPHNNRWWINTSGDRKLLNELKVEKWVTWDQPVPGGPCYTTKGFKFYLRQYALKKGLFGWNNYSTVYILTNSKLKAGNLPTVDNPNQGTSPEVRPEYNWILYTEQASINYTYLNIDYLRPAFSFQGYVDCRGLDFGLIFIQSKEHSVFP